MAKNYVMEISESYPESYWLKAKSLSGEDLSVFKECVLVKEGIQVKFECNADVSVEKFLSYDFLYSDGPNLVSPRLYKLMKFEQLSGVQFYEADLALKGKLYSGYKIINITERVAIFNIEKSISEPLLSYLPDGPRWYSKIVLNDDLDLKCDIARAKEQSSTIIASSRTKSLFEKNKIRGVRFYSQSSAYKS